MLSLDFGAIWRGVPRGSRGHRVRGRQPPSAEAEKLVRVTEESLEAGIARSAGRAARRHRPRGPAGGRGAGFAVVREYVGHGIGRALHEDPQIPNYGQPGQGPELKPGLVIAVEPMVNMGEWRDAGTGRRLDGGHRGRVAVGPFRAHHRRHGERPRGPDRPAQPRRALGRGKIRPWVKQVPATADNSRVTESEPVPVPRRARPDHPSAWPWSSRRPPAC